MTKSAKQKKGTPRETGPKIKKSVRTKAALLQAALKHFSNTGYSATSIQDIVDEADFTKPTLYYYFDSKADLFSALIEEALKDFHLLLKQAVSSGGSVREVLQNLILTSSKQAQERGSLVRLIQYSFSAAEKEIPYRDKCLQEALKLPQILEDYFAKEIQSGNFKSKYDARDIAETLLGTISHITNKQLVRKEPPISRKRAEMIIDIFLSGVQTPQ
ncbi:MAG TPA: TetR/AcrR family transcriptional regulator [Verrucomicrobiota bacterium]|nr:TetR/AcrR family transcriptional regulator [Verrucomicrobiota bacterium]